MMPIYWVDPGRSQRARSARVDTPGRATGDMSASTIGTFETAHSDAVHDCAYDYYGRRVATCSSDRTIKIFDVSQPISSTADDGPSATGAGTNATLNGTSVNGVVGTPSAVIVGHDGPVWSARWAHPKFGTLLASASFDHHVMIHKEVEPNSFVCAYKSPMGTHDGSVNACAWAPHEYGAKLASASSDGSISIISYNGASGSWSVEKIDHAHAIGCTGVSWAPAAMPGSLVNARSGGVTTVDAKRLVTCGCDNLVKIWRFDESQNVWGCEATLNAHTDWVRDVAWSENLGLPMNTIASAGQDGKVFIWTQSEPRGVWQSRLLHEFGAPVWRVSWSTMGNILAVSDGNNTVTVWKESIDGSWNQISAA